ncbi:MAG: YjbH domain-containing protein [Bacteroidia bacterium]|nr:YjbH domain-containing protein [Bacteroidia bacterium]
MKSKTCLFPLLLILLLISTGTKAQKRSNSLDSLSRALVRDGFESVGIHREKNDVYLFYENRHYRWEIDGLSKILRIASSTLSDSTILHVVPMHYEVPVTVITTGVLDYKKRIDEPTGEYHQDNLVHTELNSDDLNSIRKILKFQNRAFGKIDLFFLPGYGLTLGNEDKPVKLKFSISPILQTSLWKGSLLSFQIMIPLYNELSQKDESKVRLETAMLNQLFRLPKDVFIYGSAGIFAFPNKISSDIIYQRYGIAADVRKYFFNGRICTGFSAGYTGMMYIGEGYFNYIPNDNKFNYTFFGEYREPKFDFTTRVTAGKFLYDDTAVRVDISRQFRELAIGLFVIKSTLHSAGETGTVGGFNVIIPIAPKKGLKPSKFRVNLSRYFNWEFRERTIDPLATTYRTNRDWNETFRNLNPDFVNKQLHLP